MINKLISKNKLIEKIFIKCISKIENGEQNSKHLRKYFNEIYKIEADFFSYGCFKKTFNNGGKKIIVGRYCSIAENVRYFGANHPTKSFCMSPYFYNNSFGFNVNDVSRSVLEIEDDVWIGYNTTITTGCKKIGRGCIIGAGAIVTHDVEPYSIVAGNPAKKIKMRFNKSQIEKLEKSEWWKYSPKELIKLKKYFFDIDEFCEQLKLYDQ